MTGTDVVRSKPEVILDFTNSRTQMMIIEAVRLGFLLMILFITLTIQSVQPEFINTEVLLPVFLLLSAAFAINGLYLIFFERVLKVWAATALLFVFESIFISYLIHYTGNTQSIFLFLYLVNIILCGFVFQKRGAYFLALWTSILFSLLMILGPELKGQNLYYSMGLNNLAFFAVATLSGLLSEQLNFMGTTIQKQGRDIRTLRDLNTLIIENVTTGLMTIDVKGRILSANRAAVEILDTSQSALENRMIEEILPGLLSKTADAETSRRFDHQYESPSGDKLVLEFIISPLPDGSAIAGYILTFQDLTKIRRMEFQMRQSEKMAAIGQLAAGIAHEIRNPLASISGSIQLLGASFSGRMEEEQRLMTIILKEIDRLNNLITEFLDFVRPDAMRDDPIDVDGLVKEVCEIVALNGNLRRDVKQKVSLSASRLIAGHRDKLKQALMNIVINAYQAMTDSADPVLEVSTSAVDMKVQIKIKDTGCGMDEAGLRKLFEPFHTTKPKGTGLGLAVTHKIVENHGGRIFVESKKGVGTEFTLEFPVKEASILDENALADSQMASENFQIAFRGQKRGN